MLSMNSAATTASTVPAPAEQDDDAEACPVFSREVVDAGLRIANAIAMCRYLHEENEVLRAALAAAKRENDQLRTQLERAPGGLRSLTADQSAS
jgi:hypothetical protein